MSADAANWASVQPKLEALLARRAAERIQPEQIAMLEAAERWLGHDWMFPNGLQVILSPDHRLPLVAVNVWYHVGPANEEPGRTGFAHLFEHLIEQRMIGPIDGGPVSMAKHAACEAIEERAPKLRHGQMCPPATAPIAHADDHRLVF